MRFYNLPSIDTRRFRTPEGVFSGIDGWLEESAFIIKQNGGLNKVASFQPMIDGHMVSAVVGEEEVKPEVIMQYPAHSIQKTASTVAELVARELFRYGLDELKVRLLK